MYRIYMIEDDQGILEAVKAKGEKWELQVYGVGNFRKILTEFSEIQPHLVLMDIGLPAFDGYYWCTELRKLSKVPIIFLSSASDNMNMVMAMSMGGDDFVAKPFDMDVLLAKIQALLRRSYDFAAAMPILEHQGAFLNVENGGRIVSRERLMELLWESDCYIDDNTLTVNVGRLRKKLESKGLPGFIHTKFGVGYYIGEEPA